jgi:hypothetical protein
MAKSVEEVRVAVDGVVSTAAFGTAAPTSAVSVLAAPWKDLGYVSEDGVTESTSVSSEKIRAWQKAKVVRTTITEGTVTFQFVLIQTNADTVGLYYNGTVAADGSIIADPTRARPVLAFDLDIIDGDQIIRKYVPEGQITEVGDQVFQNGAAIGYEVTIEANHNEALGGSVQNWYSELAA